MPKQSAKFLREAVVLFGFLNGVWLGIGVNPGATLLQTLERVVEDLTGAGFVPFLFTLVPLVLLGAMLWYVGRRGGVLGFLAVGLAFVSGLVVLSAPVTSLVLLAAALAVGWFAAR